MKPILPAHLKEQIESFSGRTWLLPAVQNWLKNTSERYLIITGLPGTGKSMLMAWLAGAGPLPADPAARASLKSIRDSVRATHFCIALSGNIKPRAAAISLVEQLTENVKGFGDAIAASLVGLVTITANQSNLTVEEGASNSGVRIGRLEVTGVSEADSFSTLLRGPLQKLYANGSTETILLVIDGLDEAFDPTSDSSLPHLLSRVAELNQRVRILISCRPDPRVLKLFPGVRTTIDLGKAPADQQEIRQYAFDRLSSLSEPARSQVAAGLAAAANNIFLYASLAVDMLLKEPDRMADPAALKLPPSLEDIYSEFLVRELGSIDERWYQTYKPILGLIGVGMGGGLDKSLLDRFTGSNTEAVLRACAQYLSGTLMNGPFQLFHRSFAQFLFEEESNQDYHIAAEEMHRKIAASYCAGPGCADSAEDWDDYGLRYTPQHLANAALANPQPARHQLASQLLNLVIAPGFQDAFQNRLRDPHALKDQIHTAMRTLSEDDDPRVLAQLVETALRLESFWDSMRQPDRPLIFARQGDLQAAEHCLALYNLEPDWRQVILLCLAWLAAGADPAGSQKQLDQIKSAIAREDNGLVAHLWGRVQASLQGQPPPPPMRSFYTSMDPNIPVEILKRLSGEGYNYSLLGGNASEMILIPRGQGGGPKGYLAEADSPYLVGWAFQHRGQGEDYLSEYIDIHRDYPYIEYRNNSLKIILEYVISIPDDTWVLDKLTQCVQAALTSSAVDFKEGLGLTLAGLAGAAGGPAGPELAAYRQARQAALQASYHLPQKRTPEGEDRWSHNLRRLSTLAVIDALALNDQAGCAELLQRAESLPRGFAGFRSPASLTLAEDLWLGGAELGRITKALEQAVRAAQNIQDATFSALSNARAYAMKKCWWDEPLSNLPALVNRFCESPQSAEFASLHRVGEEYKERDPIANLPLPDWLRLANTLRELAQVYELPLSEFQRLNPAYPADQNIPAGTEIRVPDPGFTPLLAARLAAGVLKSSSAQLRVHLIQRLVPNASANLVALDAVLCRLLLAARPAPPVIQKLGSLVSQFRPPAAELNQLANLPNLPG